MTNTLPKDANQVLYEGLRDIGGLQFVAKQAGTVTTDGGGVTSSPQAVEIPDTSNSGTVTNDQDTLVFNSPGGQATALIQITGSFVMTLNFEGSADSGSTWVPVTAAQVGGSTVGTTTATPGTWQANISGMTKFRVRAHPVTSGTASLIIRGSAGINNMTITNATTLGQQTSANSSSVVVASDQTVPIKGQFTEVIGNGTGVVTGTSTDLVSALDVSAYKWFSLQMAGTFTLTVQVQGSNDNTNFFAVTNQFLSTTTPSTNASGNISAVGLYVGSINFRYLRVRCTAFTSNASLVGTLELYASAPAFAYSPLSIIAQPFTSGGTLDFHLISAASGNPVGNIKASAGQLYGYEIFNSAASTVVYVKLYNTAGSPTAGAGTPIRTIGIPGSGRASYVSTTGIAYGTGLGYAITGGIADADATAIGAAVSVQVEYK
jgi:hypothetical protein